MRKILNYLVWTFAAVLAFTLAGCGNAATDPSEEKEELWTECINAGTRNWNSIAISADGSMLAAVVYGGYIYTSGDGGATWVERATDAQRNWVAITSSADGSILAATCGDSRTYLSRDSGATWTYKLQASTTCNALCMSGDGQCILVVENDGYIYRSVNGGDSWTYKNPDDKRNWRAIAGSSSGEKLIAVSSSGTYDGDIFTSEDSGDSWNSHGLNSLYYAAAVSDDGYRTVGVYGGSLFTSSDDGQTWNECTAAGTRNWCCLDMSADGSVIAAAPRNDYLCLSTDSGDTWTEFTELGTQAWNSIAISADGTKIAAAVLGGCIYTSP